MGGQTISGRWEDNLLIERYCWFKLYLIIHSISSWVHCSWGDSWLQTQLGFMVYDDGDRYLSFATSVMACNNIGTTVLSRYCRTGIVFSSYMQRLLLIILALWILIYYTDHQPYLFFICFFSIALLFIESSIWSALFIASLAKLANWPLPSRRPLAPCHNSLCLWFF